MAFDNVTRKRLNDFVAEARSLITEEFSHQFQSLYGISAAGKITALEDLGHLDEAGLATASVLRARIDYLIRSHPAARDVERIAVERLAREQAFTVLNRLAALRMAEKRGLIVESVGRGYQSKGFQVFERIAGAGLGETYTRYRRYLFCLFDELAVDLGVLFDRRLPQAVLFPREPKLLELLGLLDAPGLAELWAEDETIGWIYQYYNDESERKKMREESSAPRNSRELAVRNQFFTPRYVVEFLTDNTLGRLWYEMRQGKTALTDQCRYLVRRPSEIFLKPGEAAPAGAKAGENRSQEELLRQPVHIPHRPLKDPREIRLLDPACGSMHFGLYAFDLFTVIYDEAWEIVQGTDDAAKSAETFAPFVTFAASFPDKAAFLREVPRLIVENNIHGIDIDPRAAQIAGLSLWLRAQRAWHQADVKLADRPRITRSNLVCAEPMPGEKELLREFVEQQFPTGEWPAFAFLLEKIFDCMTLAGEAGSLLRIEEEIRVAISEARALAQQQSKPQQAALWTGDERPEQVEFDLRGLNDEQFWQAAEQRIYEALEAYSEQAESGGGFQRRLFADDAAQGFALIDLCRKRYDVVVMNPPFGEAATATVDYVKKAYPDTFIDVLAAFVERASQVCPDGRIGALTSRACLYTKTLTEWRKRQFLRSTETVTDLGGGVLDGAMVFACATVFATPSSTLTACQAIDLRRSGARESDLLEKIEHIGRGENTRGVYLVNRRKLAEINGARFLYNIPDAFWSWSRESKTVVDVGGSARAGSTTYDDFRFLRLVWEAPNEQVGWGNSWVFFSKGGYFETFYNDIHLLVKWLADGKEVGEFNRIGYGTDAQSRRASTFYKLPGITYPRRTVKGFSPRALPRDCIFADKGPVIFSPAGTDLCFSLGYWNSGPIRALVHLQVQAGSYETGIVNSIPWPCSDAIESPVSILAKRVWEDKAIVYRLWETDRGFVPPALSSVASIGRFAAIARQQLRENGMRVVEGCREISSLVSSAFSLPEIDLEAFEVSPEDHLIEDDFGVSEDASIAFYIFQLTLGCAFGRWDIRYATGERPTPELPDPFAPLPVCPPGMLQGDDGLPLSPEAGRRLRTEGRYPLDVAWDGILVDDPEHPLDLERRVHAALNVLWGDRADALEHEACALLGVPTLREWFRRPTGFFADHLKRYSKSRRQAPIYWPLSTASGSYTLWLYYHRLTDQTLHSCLADFIEPKLKAVEGEIARAREAKRTGEIAKKQEFLDELRDLKVHIEQLIKLPWRPNLNDGVLIIAAPLWKLFGLSKWQKDLKACWEELQAGDYDWAHLAYTIWPGRVKEKCKTDRSLAIAHGLESICEVEPPKPKKAKVSRKSKSSGDDDELALEQAAPAQPRSAPKISAPKPSKSASRASDRDNGAESPVSIEDTDRDDVMCVIRQVFSRGGAREREEALKQVSEALGYQRLGTKIREVLETDLLTAVRRGILTNEGGMLSLTSGDIRDFARDSLKEDFLTALGRTWKDREEAIRLFARFLGYARTGPTIEETARSLINGLIRENRIASDGDRIRRS